MKSIKLLYGFAATALIFANLPAFADGAIAVGSTGDVVKHGVAMGYVVDELSEAKAISKAMEYCRTFKRAPDAAAKCLLIGSFKNQCFALSIDPKDGTPGVGWAIENSKVQAENIAMANCQATAGSTRRQFCIVDRSQCDTITIYNRGYSFYEKKNYDNAIQEYDKALRMNPQNAKAFNHRSIASRAKGDNNRAIADYNQAIRLYDQAIKLDPQDADAFSSRCWARAIAGRELQQALADCNQSLRLNADDASTLDSRGFTYLKLDQIDSAIADYDAALKLNPKQAGSLYGRGVTKIKKGDADAGNADIAAAKAIEADIAERFAMYDIRLDEAIASTAPPGCNYTYGLCTRRSALEKCGRYQDACGL